MFQAKSLVVKFINKESIILSKSFSEMIKNTKRYNINRLIERSEERCMMKVEMLVQRLVVAV